MSDEHSAVQGILLVDLEKRKQELIVEYKTQIAACQAGYEAAIGEVSRWITQLTPVPTETSKEGSNTDQHIVIDPD